MVSWFYNGDGTGKNYVSEAAAQPSADGERLVWSVVPPADVADRWHCRFVVELDEVGNP